MAWRDFRDFLAEVEKRGDVNRTNGPPHLYIADRCSVAVHRYALDGSGGPFVRFTHGYRFLAGIAFDDSGVLYVAVGSAYRPHNLILQIRGVE